MSKSSKQIARAMGYDWKRICRLVKERDRQCVKCSSGDRLEVHHDKPAAHFPELRHDMNNLQLLCRSCHIREHMRRLKRRGVHKAPPADAMTHRWAWKFRLPKRLNQLCRVLKRGSMNTILVEFNDGFLVVTKAYSVQRAKGGPA